MKLLVSVVADTFDHSIMMVGIVLFDSYQPRLDKPDSAGGLTYRVPRAARAA